MQLQVVPWPVIVITHVINLLGQCYADHTPRVGEIFLDISEIKVCQSPGSQSMHEQVDQKITLYQPA